MLEPNEVIVVANKGLALQDFYGFPPDFEMQDTTIPDLILYHTWSSGKIELLNSGDDHLVNALTWGSSTWDSTLDPPPPPQVMVNR